MLESVSSAQPTSQGITLGPILYCHLFDPFCENSNWRHKFSRTISRLLPTSLTAQPTSVVQSDIEAVVDWADEHGVPISVEKCSVLHCGLSRFIDRLGHNLCSQFRLERQSLGSRHRRHNASVRELYLFLSIRVTMCFLISGPKCWNQLPNNVTIINNFAMFLTAVVSYIKSKLLTN
jgi:hypothetical protein